jgi:hypothetical protein
MGNKIKGAGSDVGPQLLFGVSDGNLVACDRRSTDCLKSLACSLAALQRSVVEIASTIVNAATTMWQRH